MLARCRDFARKALAHLQADALDPINLMLSELATNCIRFTPGDFVVSIDDMVEQIRVEVADSGGGVPSVRSPSAAEPSGRGLMIVQAMSADWGVDRNADDSGKTVWFVVSLGVAHRHSPT